MTKKASKSSSDLTLSIRNHHGDHGGIAKQLMSHRDLAKSPVLPVVPLFYGLIDPQNRMPNRQIPNHFLIRRIAFQLLPQFQILRLVIC